MFKRQGKAYGYVWGCLHTVGRSFKLGYYDDEGPDFFAVSPIRLAGPYVGFNVGGETRNGYEADVISLDLRNGRRLYRWLRPAVGRGPGEVLVQDLELKKNGSIGWIASRSTEMGTPINQVYKSDTRGKKTVLDSSSDIDPHSLTLSQSTLRWIKGDQQRSAPLN